MAGRTNTGMLWVAAFVCMCVYMGMLWVDWDLFQRTPVKAAGVIIAGFAAFRDCSGATPGAKKYGRLVSMGLFFSSIGDIMLELSIRYDIAFLVGLVAFLIGHILYIVAFKPSPLRLSFVPFLLFAVGMVAFLHPGLPSDLVIPVCVYATVICTMGHSAFARYGSSDGTQASQWLALLGALDFIISDTVLAINKFRHPFDAAKTIVMITYFSAQLLIGRSVRANNPLKRSD